MESVTPSPPESPPPADVAGEDPGAALKDRVKAFYNWYLTGLLTDPKFPKERPDIHRLRQEVTVEIADGLTKPTPGNHSDPLLRAQDFFPEWAWEFEVRLTDETHAEVTFGPPPGKQHQLLLTFAKEADVLKIAGIARKPATP